MRRRQKAWVEGLPAARRPVRLLPVLGGGQEPRRGHHEDEVEARSARHRRLACARAPGWFADCRGPPARAHQCEPRRYPRTGPPAGRRRERGAHACADRGQRQGRRGGRRRRRPLRPRRESNFDKCWQRLPKFDK